MSSASIISIVVGIVGLVAAFISSLMTKKRNLESKVSELQYGSKIRESLLKKDEQEKVANEQEDKYDAVRDAFIKQHGSDGSTDE